jgi:hypothetical protein
MTLRGALPFLLLAAAAAQTTDPSGHWEGTVDAPKGPTVLTLDLAKNARGEWTASLGVPQQKATGIRVSGIKVEGGKLQFSAPDLPGVPAFDLALQDGKLSGTLAVRDGSLPLEMKRTGEAKVEITPPGPAVSKELEGDWRGEMSLPGGQTREVLVHFKNQPDNTVAASIDSPSQGAKGLELAGIRQTGRVVEFELALKAAGGSYKGTLNESGTEMTGEWTQRANTPPIPLTLKKK